MKDSVMSTPSSPAEPPADKLFIPQSGAGNERVLWDAKFNPKTAQYWLINGAIIFVVTIVGIPLLPFWLLIGSVVTKKYLSTHSCVLTNRNLKFSRGIFVKQEKTVPLDRITDLGLVQGPIMRAMDIEALSVETAGQSSAGSFVQLTGVERGREFRDAVLAQRDSVVGSEEERSGRDAAVTQPAFESGSVELLRQMNATLERIEKQLAERG